MTIQNPYKYFKTSPEIIQLAVMYYVRYPLSLRQVEDILHERGIDVCHETVRFWWNRFGPKLAKDIRKKRVDCQSNWCWHIDEVFVKISGRTFYLWRTIDHEGEVLECYVSKRRDKHTALKILRKLMKRYGKSHLIVTDKLRSYSAALRVLGALNLHDTTQYLNNQVENSHLPFRQRERAMQRFRSHKTLQKFTSIHSQYYNHFNHQRHLNSRQVFKQTRNAALTEWRQLCVA